jgi:hypothetical protein
MARQTVMTRRAVAAATAGSTIEFYDFLLYGVVAALVFPGPAMNGSISWGRSA